MALRIRSRRRRKATARFLGGNTGVHFLDADPTGIVKRLDNSDVAATDCDGRGRRQIELASGARIKFSVRIRQQIAGGLHSEVRARLLGLHHLLKE
jgi:hypothetical protein